MNDKLTLLILDDEQDIRQELSEFFEHRGFKVLTAEKPSVAFTLMKQAAIDIALVDIKLPEMDGLEVIKKLKQGFPATEVIVMTGHGDMNTVIAALRLGAHDFFAKPFRAAAVLAAVERTGKYIDLQNRLKRTNYAISYLNGMLNQERGASLIGVSAAFKQVVELMTKVAPAETTVLVCGESGTGKEIVARGLHQLSNRKNEMFYAINCSAVPASLFESEFFGHVRGAFTGAQDDKPGAFELARGGTLFLDEIGDIPSEMQTKLLRVLEEKKLRRVGSAKEIAVDTRIVAASNRNLEQEIATGSFRLDLFHRLGRFMITLPPLRERSDDINPLLNHYLAHFALILRKPVKKISAAARALLLKHPFYGNVRELKNMIENAIILADGNCLELEHFPGLQVQQKANKQQDELDLDIEKNERRLLLKALELTGKNKSQAAHLLGISWNSLDRRMKKFDIE